MDGAAGLIDGVLMEGPSRRNYHLTRSDVQAAGQEKGSKIGQGAGSVIGGAIGTIIAPGIGTAIGASLGGMAGGALGSGIGRRRYDRRYRGMIEARAGMDSFRDRLYRTGNGLMAEEMSRAMRIY